MTAEQEFDYIIVGAGSAGCVLARRLSDDPTARVLLIEAGPEDDAFWIKIPAGMTRLFKPGPINWGYSTEAEHNLGGRSIYWPRGRTLGGTSAINGMVYMRGHPDDYDSWVRMGAAGWGWSDILPYYLKAEDHFLGPSALHGKDGPLTIAEVPLKDRAGDLFIKSAIATGLPFREDLNDGVQEGVGRPQLTVKRGRRVSAATAYLHPVRSRKNLTVMTDTFVRKIIVEGRRATAVQVVQDSVDKRIAARREVILCGGVVNSPQLLMLSGIGPSAHLKDHGIDVVCDLPGVGENLQDHVFAYYVVETVEKLSVNRALRGGLPLLWNAARFFTTGGGQLNIASSQATALPRVGPEAVRPDVEISFRPMSWDIVGGEVKLHDFPGLNAACALFRPKARGNIRLVSPDARSAPRIVANYLGHEDDRRVMRQGLQWTRNVFATEPLAQFVKRECTPGPDVVTDDQWDRYLRDEAQTVYHPVGTCRMGQDDFAVVDPSLRVRGIDGLRVIDASVMPHIPSCNTHAPTVAIAERGADLITGKIAAAAPSVETALAS